MHQSWAVLFFCLFLTFKLSISVMPLYNEVFSHSSHSVWKRAIQHNSCGSSLSTASAMVLFPQSLHHLFVTPPRRLRLHGSIVFLDKQGKLVWCPHGSWCPISFQLWHKLKRATGRKFSNKKWAYILRITHVLEAIRTSTRLQVHRLWVSSDSTEGKIMKSVYTLSSISLVILQGRMI